MSTVDQSTASIGAIILAGGESRRFGSDKTLHPFRGIPLIQYVTETASRITENILIVTNSPEKFDFLPYPKYEDLIPSAGPLGGIYTGLSYSASEVNLVLACDMPFISYECLKYLIQNTNGNGITVPAHRNLLEPLCAIYTRSCLPFIKAQLENGNYRIRRLYDKIDTKKLALTTETAFYQPQLFSNINSRQDLSQLE